LKLETCRFEVADGIALVTLARPPVNAQNQQLRRELIFVFDAMSDRDDVRVAIVTGEGHVFSAGADIKERRNLVQAPGDYLDHNRLTREFFYAPADCSKPVIAAVNGAAIGAGFALALYCDIILAADDAFAAMPELDVGLAGGGRMMMDHFGKSWARLLYFSGRRITAPELYRLGVISASVPGATLMDEAYKLAKEIAAKSPTAVSRVKQGFSFVESMSAREAYRYEQNITHELSETADTKAAQAAFGRSRRGD
jgi:enoyl-CoA hydratase